MTNKVSDLGKVKWLVRQYRKIDKMLEDNTVKGSFRLAARQEAIEINIYLLGYMFDNRDMRAFTEKDNVRTYVPTD